MSRNTHPRSSLSRSILTGAILVLSAPLYAQAASYTYIDQKAPYKNANPPMLTAPNNVPKVGSTFRVRIPNSYLDWDWWNARPVYAEDYALALGVKNPDLRMPSLGGFLFTSADLILVRSIPRQNGGTVTVDFQIPNSPQLMGIHFYQQVLMIRSLYVPSRNAWVTGEVRLSRGGHGVIGK